MKAPRILRELHLTADRFRHLTKLLKTNAAWHRAKFKETGDRYYLGQWKAYYRMYIRSSKLEY